MIDERFNYDENDEMTDEQYFSEDDGRELTEDDNAQISSNSDGQRDSQEEDEEYRVSSINANFLRAECQIKVQKREDNDVNHECGRIVEDGNDGKEYHRRP